MSDFRVVDCVLLLERVGGSVGVEERRMLGRDMSVWGFRLLI